MSTIRSSVVHWLVGIALFCVVLAGSVAAQPATIGAGGDLRPLPGTAATASNPLPNSPLLRASAKDAGLNSIAIINEDRLCAVGDCGIILVTEDAGRSWVQQSSGTTCNLYAVAFEGEVGFAVGGWIGPFTGLSYGAILKSLDGGRTWNALACEQLARLRGVGIVRDRLLVWGDYCPQLKASAMESVDGGISWRGITDGLGHVSAMGMSDAGAWGAIDSLGNALFPQRRQLQTVAHPNAPIRRLLHDNRRWIGGGANGELITSLDGANWSNVPLPLSPDARSLFDCLAMTRYENHMWIGGSPGSVLFYSNDGGEHWGKMPTGQNLPVHDIRFVDKNRGWLVGAQGLILATRDGGVSWYPQRQNAQRTAVLSFVQESESVPWLPLVAAVWDEQYSATSIVAESSDPLEKATFQPSQAMRLSSTAPQVGLAQHETWSIEHETIEQATRRLVLALLTWRPDVVLTDERSVGQVSQSATQRLSVSESIQRAATSGEHLSVAGELGLAPWQVSKLVSVCTGKNAQYGEQASRVVGNSGIALWDVLMPLSPDDRERSQSVSMRTVWARSQANVLQSSLLGGIARDPAFARDLALGKIGNYQLVMGRIHRNRSLEQIVEQPESESTEDQWRARLMFLLDTLPAPEVAPALVHQSRHAIELGYFKRQQIILETLADRAPLVDAAGWARYEMLRLASSDEFSAWRNRAEAAQGNTIDLAGASSELSPRIKQAVWNASPFETQTASTPNVSGQESPAVVTASSQATEGANVVVADLMSPRQIPQLKWLSMLDQLAQKTPTLLSRPDLKMLVAQNMLRANNAMGHVQVLDSVASQQWMIGWSRAAQQELLLANNRIEELSCVSFVTHASMPPILDGEWNEAFWTAVPPMKLSEWDTEPSSSSVDSKLAWAYDDRYLYIAIECPRIGSKSTELANDRQYDANISHLDHIQVTLDTDRDYSSVIELGIAENGQTYDRCCGFTNFNPKWHVMVKPDVERWRAEIAIELSELTTTPTLGGGAWAVSARRVNGGQPVASWSTLKTHEAHNFASGLLLFAH